jgi:hypothetical protein
MIPLHRSSKPVYEYACHEGNYSLAGILAGAAPKNPGSRHQSKVEIETSGVQFIRRWL